MKDKFQGLCILCVPKGFKTKQQNCLALHNLHIHIYIYSFGIFAFEGIDPFLCSITKPYHVQRSCLERKLMKSKFTLVLGLVPYVALYFAILLLNKLVLFNNWPKTL